MPLRFTKMQGCGNDFIVIDRTRQPFDPTPDLVRRLADRHFGIGCDQLLLISRSDRDTVDLDYRIFNADGGEVSQCGNGLRCVARYARDHGLVNTDRMVVASQAGLAYPELHGDGSVTVDMGPPRFDPAAIPFEAPGVALDYAIAVGGETQRIAVLSMGNPHAVLQVPDCTNAPVQRIGEALSRDPAFPEGVNVGFLQIENRHRVQLRVHERGSGETLACGTGACAAVVAGIRWGKLAAEVRVALPGGELTIRWEGGERAVFLSRPATTVFEGEITL